ncbi:hypothetical protein [Rhodopirellula sp. SWK7]|uniref:hypothetical protein n=1 Tax=Rhodopirellula sp. SWK7 TaxID=595460 RepID=UPI0002BFE2B2|nr:hypothetical protein [Rhodopirellula sp. SWK7]EMI41231.1 putative secreted protein [Rhodopirellula sp. SWK7]
MMRSSAKPFQCFLIALSTLSLSTFAPTAKSEDAVEGLGIEVKLVDAGGEPRRLVRLSPEVGQIQEADMIIEMKQQISLGGAAMPSQPIPAQKMTMKVEVTDVSSDGDISFDFEYTDMKVVDDPNNPSPIAATLEKMLEPMIGSTGRGVVTNRGITKQGEFDIPEDLSPQLKQMLAGMKDAMNRLSSPVPEEAIGDGAQWKVIQRIVANGMKLTQTSTHTITNLSGTGFEMSVEIEQKADPQEIENPMLPAGTKLKLDSLESTGSGKTTISESAIFPASSKVTVHTVSSMSIDAAGQNQKMKTDMTMGMSLQPIGE